MEQVIHVRDTKEQVLRELRNLPAQARGSSQVAKGLMTRLGFALLDKIRKEFIVKARGGTDESGLSWKPLSPKTIAYSRRHPGLPGKKVRAKKAPSYALTKKGREKWWKDYRYGLYLYDGDKSHAAARAWVIAKASGETTLLEKYGNTPVEILRDTGLLLNSLSPGVHSRYQVFRVGKGEVIVGTNRKHAGVHHRGNRRVPQRRLWPSPKNWPASWWSGILQQTREGMVEIVLWMLRRRTR